jgi:hypothetical protein
MLMKVRRVERKYVLRWLEETNRIIPGSDFKAFKKFMISGKRKPARAA